MINKTVDLASISFEEVPYSKELYESIATRGIAIPIKVEVKEDGFLCVDGKKRLTIAKQLAKENPKFNRIPIMITNDFSKSGSAFWGNTQNKH